MISNILSDTFGKTSLSLIDLSLNKDTIKEEEVKSLVYRNVKVSIEELMKSIEGKYEEEQKVKIEICLKNYKDIMKSIEDFDKKIIKLANKYEKEIKIIQTFPGINLLSAIHITAKKGNDMKIFRDAKHLCSWCGLTPQNNESAGKKKSVRISDGGSNIKPILIQCALATIRSKESRYFKNKYEDLKRKKGHKKAIIAIARMIIICIYNMLSKEQEFNYKIYEELNNKKFKTKKKTT